MIHLQISKINILHTCMCLCECMFYGHESDITLNRNSTWRKDVLAHGFRLPNAPDGGGKAEQFRLWACGGRSKGKRWFTCQMTKEAGSKEGSSKTFKGTSLVTYYSHWGLMCHSIKDFSQELHWLKTTCKAMSLGRCFKSTPCPPLTPQADKIERNKNRPLKFPEDHLGFIEKQK